MLDGMMNQALKIVSNILLFVTSFFVISHLLLDSVISMNYWSISLNLSLFLVMLFLAKYINDLFEDIECPHITTSVSEFGKPVDTYKLFSKKCPIEEELFVVIKGTFGNFVKPGYPVFK